MIVSLSDGLVQKKGSIGLCIYVPRGWYKLQAQYYWVLLVTTSVLRYYYWLTYSYLLYRVRLVREVGYRANSGHVS